MSRFFLHAAWRADLPPIRKFVLVAMADIADEGGEVFITVGRLAARCGTADRSIQRSLCELIDGGFLRRDLRKGRSSIFVLTDPQKWPMIGPDSTGDTESPPTECHPRQSVTPDRVSPHGCQGVTPATGDTESPPTDSHLRQTVTPDTESSQGGQGVTPLSQGGDTVSPITRAEELKDCVCLAGAREDAEPGTDGAGGVTAEDSAPGAPTAAALACQAMIAAGLSPSLVSFSHPDLIELAPLCPASEFATAAKFALDKRKGRNAFAFALGVVRNRLDDAAGRRAAAATLTSTSTGSRPGAADTFKGKTYAGTADNQLPAEFRNAVGTIGT